MIVQKQDKKKLYINIAVLVFILALILYLLLGSLGSSETSTTDELGVGEGVNTIIVKKYGSLKKINTDLFEDERLKNLREPVRNERPIIKKGNLNPFEEIQK